MSKPNMIKRADGSYSKHGLWDSIRENKGSGKAPTKEMLKQEKKIKAKYDEGGITGKPNKIKLNTNIITNKQDNTVNNSPQLRQKNQNWANQSLTNGSFNPNKMYAKGNVEEATLDAMAALDLPFALGKGLVRGIGKGLAKETINPEILSKYSNVPNKIRQYTPKNNTGKPLQEILQEDKNFKNVWADPNANKLIDKQGNPITLTHVGKNPNLINEMDINKINERGMYFSPKGKYDNFPENTTYTHANPVIKNPYFAKTHGELQSTYALEGSNYPAKDASKNYIDNLKKQGYDAYVSLSHNRHPLNQKSLADAQEIVLFNKPELIKHALGGTINNQAMKTNKYNNGGTIHIKPENKGKFNATKKATGKTTEELTHSKNPVTKKRAIFAQNAAKWKHAEGGEIDPKNTFGLTGNYSRTPNPEAIESNYKLAADYQRRLGNFNAGLNANLGFDHNLPLNTEQFNGSPTIIPNANLGLNVDYDRNNNNFSGSFNYNPINQGINAEVTYKKRFADGGTSSKRVPIKVTDPNDPRLRAYNDSNYIRNNSLETLKAMYTENPDQWRKRKEDGFSDETWKHYENLIKLNNNQVIKPQSVFTRTIDDGTNIQERKVGVYKKPVQPYVYEKPNNKPVVNNRENNNLITYNSKQELDKLRADTKNYKEVKTKDGYKTLGFEKINNVVKPKINTKPVYQPVQKITPIAQQPIVNKPIEQVKPQYTSQKQMYQGREFMDSTQLQPGWYHPEEITERMKDPNRKFDKGGRVLPKYAEAGWLTKNKAGVGAGLGFAGDTTNLLFDNNVFGTRNKVTDSEGNVLGEAQSDAGSQTQGALSGALKGASAGAALGPWGMAGGALIGGVAGFLTADTGAEDKLNQIKKERNAQISFKNMLGKGPIENNSIQTNSLALSAYGGYINKKYANGGMKTLNQNHPEATEEVELGESAMLPNGMNLAFGGETHENGGLETNLPEGTRIFSDRIKSGKRTIASIAKPIQNKIEKLKDNNSKAGQNTIKLFENQLDNLFNEQEEIKQQQDMAQQRKYFAKGGLKNKKSYRYQPPGAEAMENENDLSELNNIYVKGDANTQTGKNYNDYTDEELFGTSPVVTPLMTDYKGTYGNTRPIDTSEPRFNKGDIGTAGALGTSLLGNLIQRNNLNKVAPPRTLVAPTFTAGRTPVKADYSADLQSADNQFNAARRGVMMNSGNYSTQAGNLGQLRAEQLRNRSKILQNQNNANAVLMNEYQKAQADAINKNALSNYTTDQENMENLYNYNLWKTGQTNAADASAFNTSGQMFNNMVTGQNQLDAAEMYRRMYAQKVRDDLAFKAMGGTVRNYFAKGGTVYSQKLQNVLKEDTNTKAAQMDAEYASYLDAKGQPLQDTFKSKVTGLDYKVLPRKEKDLYAAKLWEEAHGSAPTKSQVAATTKAIEGKKTSSPGAKTVAQMMSDKFSVSDQEASLVNAVNADREDTMSYLPSQIENNKLKQGLNRQQVENLPKATGEAEYYDMTDFIPSKGALMGGAALAGLGFGYLKRQAMKELPNVLESGMKMGKIINAAARTEELAATKLSDKAFKSSRTKFSNKQSKNWVENGGRQRKLDMESTPEFLNKKRNSILEQEDEAFIQSKNNKMLEQKLKISEGADRYPKRSLEKMNKNLDNQEIPTAKEIENLERYSKNNKKLEDKLNFAENELDNTVIKAKEKKSNIAIKSLETRMKNAKKAGDVDKFNSLKSKYLKLMEMEQ